MTYDLRCFGTSLYTHQVGRGVPAAHTPGVCLYSPILTGTGSTRHRCTCLQIQRRKYYYNVISDTLKCYIIYHRSVTDRIYPKPPPSPMFLYS